MLCSSAARRNESASFARRAAARLVIASMEVTFFQNHSRICKCPNIHPLSIHR